MIRNAASLCDHGDVGAREALVGIAERALDRVHPGTTVPDAVSLEGDALRVGGRTYDLGEIDDVYVIGAGKGSLAVVDALRAVLGDRVTGGLIAEKAGGDGPPGVDVIEAGHPIPDAGSLRAGERALEVARAAGPDDLVFACVTGGASALLARPAGEIDGDDLADLTERLLHAGLAIDEINAVRKHVSAIKGGRLAEAIAPARTVTLVVVDEVANEPWGPTVPDRTTFDDAVDVLERHDLLGAVPDTVRERLRRGVESRASETPTPDRLAGLRTRTVVLADAADACEAARDAARDRGYGSMILSTAIEGESREVGLAFAGIAKEVVRHARPVEPPCVVVSGGETTVTVPGDAGEGGPNQEFALRFALAVEGLPGVAALAIGTDGTDGPTDVAGGLVDDGTAGRARESGIDLFERLRRHDATPALDALDDAVRTGPTGTNVMDLRLVLVE